MKGGGFKVSKGNVNVGNSMLNGPLGQLLAVKMMQKRAGAQEEQIPNAMPMGGTNPFTGTSQKTPLALAEPSLIESEKEKIQSGLNLEKAINLLGNTVSHVKGMWDEQAKSPMTNNPLASVFGTFPKYGGPARSAITNFAASNKMPGFDISASLPAQLTQTALSEMGILSGQNRLIRDVFNELKNVNIGTDDTPGTLETKVRQTVYDLAGLNKAALRLGLTHENLAKYSQMSDEQMNPQEQQLLSNWHIDPLDEQDRNALEPLIQKLLGLPSAAKFQTGVPGYSNASPIPGMNANQKNTNNDPAGLFS